VPAWGSIPWGLGAWGSNEFKWDGTPIKKKDRRNCINGVRKLLESGDYPRM